MEIFGPLHRLAVGRDRRRQLPASRFHVYAVPLGLLVLIGLGLGNSAYLTDTRGLASWAAATLTVLTVLPVALAFAGRPLFAWRVAYPVVFLGVIGMQPDEPWPWTPVQLLAFLVVFGALALREDSGVVAWVTTLTIVPIFVYAPEANAWGAATGIVAIALVGDTVSRRRRSREQLAEQAELTELEQARRAVLQERTRIAREMHDVVAHHMSMIAVQAETAPYRVDGVNEVAQQEFLAIATAARAALTDMRRLLGVLRSDNEPALAPQPGLSDVVALVAAASRAGISVTFPRAASLPSDVPEAVGLAAYRIVQEALANAARHAPGGQVHIAVRGASGALLVEVENGPAVDPAPRPGGKGGHGLIGMRERAAALGGSLDAGPQSGGGFLVAARLPFTASPVAAPLVAASPVAASPVAASSVAASSVAASSVAASSVAASSVAASGQPTVVRKADA
ncbi:sensor histidine kinase [Winogradskya humida]|uniref:histidine kinase n=1 Tax=Winogradskya humida TaxID=113566 RepID=A0ABQ3ZF24_9ACTN|nr:histidine kinase [Actinoplanes humidus]GIE17175.1 two-component sensor histidine kinase [Actinoplanes humidus]